MQLQVSAVGRAAVGIDDMSFHSCELVTTVALKNSWIDYKPNQATPWRLRSYRTTSHFVYIV